MVFKNRLTEKLRPDILESEVCSVNPEQTQWLEHLYRDYYGKLTIYAAATLRSQSRAQDIVQDTFHEALRHVDTLMEHPNPGGWLMVTLKNKLREDSAGSGAICAGSSL